MRAMRGAIVLMLAVWPCGCSSQANPSRRADAETSYIKAIEALEQHDYGLAIAAFTEALEAEGLEVDDLLDAYIQRALCSARLGEFDAAHADLDAAAEGPAEMDVVHAARSFVFQKQGRANEAAQQLNQARRINPGIQPFTD